MNVVPITDGTGAVVDAALLAAAEAVHRQLRPHLPADYARRMREVFASGARMAVALVDGQVAGVAVFRILEMTHSGRNLYCDDLVTDERRRSTGVGRALMRFMERIGAERGCDTFSLDSGTARRQAHKFYFREGMTISSFHFDKKASGKPTGIKVS